MLKQETCRTCFGTRQVKVETSGKDDAVVVITKPCPACCPCGVVKAGGYMTK